MLKAFLTNHGTETSQRAELPLFLRSPGSEQYPCVTPETAREVLPADMFDRTEAAAENFALVRFLARQLHSRLPQHIDLEDLVSAGMVGLLDAVARFDGLKKVQFRTYAQFRIRGAMMDSLRAMDWSPRTLRRQGRLLEQVREQLNGRGITTPDDQQLADEMGLPLASCQQLLADLKNLEELDPGVGEDDSLSEQIVDTLPGSQSNDPLLLCMQGEMREELLEAIEGLPEKERLVLKLHYHEELTMKTISQIMGVVGSRVSQLHTAGVQRLRHSLRCRVPTTAVMARSKVGGFAGGRPFN